MEEWKIFGGVRDLYKNLFPLTPLHQSLVPFAVWTFLFNTLQIEKGQR